MKKHLSELIYRKTIENQGFTVNLPGSSPVSGYCVSLKGTERQVDIHDFNPAVVEQFIRAHLYLLAYQDLNHIGTWIDGDIVYLDISINVQDELTALYIAEQNGQIAIYDVLEAKVLHVVYE